MEKELRLDNALDVNSYEKMPYCYLITAYTMQCNMYLLNNDYDAASLTAKGSYCK